MRHGFTSGQSTSKTAVTIHLNTSKYERNKSIFKVNKATDIVNKLREEDLCCMTVFEGEGTGHYSDNRKEWSSLKHPFSYSKIAKIEMVVPDEKVSKATQIIHENGKTGFLGDGIIYVTEVSVLVKVKTLKPDDQL
jgi:nitrogen regulatory protein P-II 1